MGMDGLYFVTLGRQRSGPKAKPVRDKSKKGHGMGMDGLDFATLGGQNLDRKRKPLEIK